MLLTAAFSKEKSQLNEKFWVLSAISDSSLLHEFHRPKSRQLDLITK
jgi:hypothetical protein